MTIIRQMFDTPLKRRAFTSGALGSLAIIAIAIYFISQSNAFFLRLAREHLQFLAQDAARTLDAEAHATLTTEADMAGPNYLKITHYLEDLQMSVPSVISAYTIRILGGEMFLIVSPPADLDHDGAIEGELEERDPIGLPYGQPPDEAMMNAALLGRPFANRSFVTDRWGTWLTGCAPLRTSATVLDGAICVDEDVTYFDQTMFATNVVAGTFAALAVCLFVLALIGYLRANIALQACSIAERERRTALERFQGAIENAPAIAVKALDQNGIIRLWNRTSEAIYGYPKEEALGREFAELAIPPPERASFRREVERIWMTQRAVLARRRQVVAREGSLRHVLSSMFPTFADGRVTEIFCMDVDISSEHQARQELEDSLEKMKSYCDVMISREERVMELKREINELCRQLRLPPRHES